MPRITLTPELGRAICARVAAGESLTAICRDEGMPNRTTVHDWVDTDAAFADAYTQARARGFDVMAEQLAEIAEETEVVAEYQGEAVTLKLDSVAVQRNRLRVDTRKWLLSKWAPKKYAERTVLAGDPEAPLAVAVDVSAATPEQLRALASLKLPNEGKTDG